jgi:hypothetical protein
MRLLAIDDCVTMTAGAHHQVILTSTPWPVSVMVPGRRKPADIRRVNRTDQRMLSRMGQDRARDDEHVLPGKAFPELYRLCQGMLPTRKTS